MKGKELKEKMKSNCSEGFEFQETEFSMLEELLEHNAAYCGFKFKEGKRSNENIEGGTKFLILDIDKSKLKDTEAHLLLEEYNHFIARTSDPDNAYKFRVLIELDSILDVDPILWREFLVQVEHHLGFVIDLLPKSQIYFSFENRKILKNLKGKPLVVKPLLDDAIYSLANKPKQVKNLTTAEKKFKLENKRDTFSFAYEANVGERSRKLYGALADAVKLGCTEDEIEALALEINSYWSTPMKEQRLYNTLINPAKRRV